MDTSSGATLASAAVTLAPAASLVVEGIPSSGNSSCNYTFSYLQGWAYDVDGPIKSVTISVNGVNQGEVTYGQSRPDICGGTGSKYPNAPGCPYVGWKTFSTGAIGGSAFVTVTATSAAGAIQTATTYVGNDTPYASLNASIGLKNGGPWSSSSQPVSGVAFGIDNWQGVTLNTVTLSLDGNALGAASITPITASSTGFDDTWSLSLDTTQFANGWHTLQATENTSAGCATNSFPVLILNPAGTGNFAPSSPSKQYIYMGDRPAASVNGAH